MAGLRVNLNWEEAQALKILAESELRDPRDQVRVIVRQELQRRGLLPMVEFSEPKGMQAQGHNVAALVSY
jgi:hypothetical protein